MTVPPNSPEPDIHQALDQVSGAKTCCPITQRSKAFFGQVLSYVRQHPWHAALGLVVAMACAKWACVYFGTMVLAGLMVWAARKSQQAQA
jgi:hypothetical protein